MAYLIAKKDPGHSLYPNDAAERARIDRMLFFECGTLIPAQISAFYVVFMLKHPDPSKIQQLHEKLAMLEQMLEGKTYISGGNSRTIADLSMICTLTALECFGVHFSRYPNINSWYKTLRSELPYDKEINTDAVNIFKKYIKDKEDERDALEIKVIDNLDFKDRQGNY
jgi:glutathione S-transferase